MKIQLFSKPTQIDLQSLFNRLGKINELVELTLAGNLPLHEMNRLVWKTNDNESSYWKSTGINKEVYFVSIEMFFDILDSKVLESTIVGLNPMEIKTFQVTLQ